MPVRSGNFSIESSSLSENLVCWVIDRLLDAFSFRKDTTKPAFKKMS